MKTEAQDRFTIAIQSGGEKENPSEKHSSSLSSSLPIVMKKEKRITASKQGEQGGEEGHWLCDSRRKMAHRSRCSSPGCAPSNPRQEKKVFSMQGWEDEAEIPLDHHHGIACPESTKRPQHPFSTHQQTTRIPQAQQFKRHKKPSNFR